MKKLKVVTVLLIVFSITIWSQQSSLADYPDMDMQATPNPVGSGARAMGMGGAFIGVADDATAASWNPAGLLQLTKPELSIVGSYFSGENEYGASHVDGGDITDHSSQIFHLNYASGVLPFTFFNRNLVLSFNYQHLYEFSMDISKTWREEDAEGVFIDKLHKDSKHQQGSLCTLSPARAFMIKRFLFLGVTCNFWDHELLDNGWENINTQYAEGTEIRDEPIITRSEIYEKYDFSGFNMNFGFLLKSDYFRLFGKKRQIQFGGVLKTPFKADIQHEKQEKVYTEFPEDPVLNYYYDHISRNNLTLEMPLSYGLGLCFHFSESLALAVDVYKTHWDQYVLVYDSDDRWSPINKKREEEAKITPTTQIRCGGEYVFQNPKRDIHLRMGFFYDPEPAGDRPDDVYGASCGSGITYRGESKKEFFALDFVYHYRFGDKQDVETLQGESIDCEIKEHYFYASVIFYLI